MGNVISAGLGQVNSLALVCWPSHACQERNATVAQQTAANAINNNVQQLKPFPAPARYVL